MLLIFSFGGVKYVVRKNWLKVYGQIRIFLT